MRHKIIAVLTSLVMLSLPSLRLAASDKEASSGKPLIVVKLFTTASENTWPYDMKKMQVVTASEIESICEKYEVTTDEIQAGRTHYYSLEGKVLSWHPGSMHWPVTSRENAEIQFWVSDESGKKVFESKDTIRGGMPNYGADVGFLLHPFADKIAHRLKYAKLR
jgi:hypothetical protein